MRGLFYAFDDCGNWVLLTKIARHGGEKMKRVQVVLVGAVGHWVWGI